MQPKPICNRGDVVLVLFPHSDLRTAKTRPALVIQADDLDTGVGQVIVAMISGRMFRAGHPSRVVINVRSPLGRASGLLGDSVVMTDNVATVSLIAVERVIGVIPMKETDAALRYTFAL
jgi:mRNA interferase MazF